jgi:hypothetical protein
VTWNDSLRESVVKVDDIITVERVMRNVGMWGDDTSKAVVRFDSEDYVQAPVVAEYGIDNGNLEGVEEYVSKFSEGSQGKNGVLIDDMEVVTGSPRLNARRCTLVVVDAGSVYLQRLPQPYVADCGDIAVNSTHVTVKCNATEAAFFSLKHNDMLNVRGQLYRWASAQWSGGVMTLDLQRISQGGGEVEPPLPYDAEIEYLESTGAQYIDTGYKNWITSVYIYSEVAFTSTSGRQLEGAVNSFYVGCNAGRVEAMYVTYFGTIQADTKIILEKSVVKSGNNVSFTIKKDGYTGYTRTQAYTGNEITKNIAFFNLIDNTSLGMKCKKYANKLIIDGVLVRDYIPVRVGTTGYMYDRVSRQLFGNAGTGDFIVGPDKN